MSLKKNNFFIKRIKHTNIFKKIFLVIEEKIFLILN